MWNFSISNIYLCNTVVPPLLCYFEFYLNATIGIYDINLCLEIIVVYILLFFSIVLLFVVLWVLSSCFSLLVEGICNFRFHHISCWLYVDLIDI